jgi:hypothetical protein
LPSASDGSGIVTNNPVPVVPVEKPLIFGLKGLYIPAQGNALIFYILFTRNDL